MSKTLIPIVVYLIPLIILSYMTIEILLRNPKKIEYRLLSLYFGSYVLLFLEEYIRQIVPIAYSPLLVTYWFGNVGLLIPCLFLHFIAKILSVDRKLPKWLTPYIFYIPLIPVVLTFVFQQNFMNSQQFVQIGLWKYPEFNASYIITLTAANLFHALIIGVTIYIRTKLKIPEQKRVITFLIVAAMIVLIWDIVFGYISYRGVIPPYPYIFGGIIWGIALSYAMYKFEFLSSFNKRYQTLYNLNPAAIVLLDSQGIVRDANPSAMQLFEVDTILHTPFENYIALAKRQKWGKKFQQFFSQHLKFSAYETKICTSNAVEKYVLIEGDYVFIDNALHTILIIRDIHDRKLAQEKIHFLAYHDALTKISNRLYFYEFVNKAITDKEPFAIVVVDLDAFKPINDTYGHHVGDLFLIHLATLLDAHVKDCGLAARMGGDEFCLFVNYENRPLLEKWIQQLLITFQKQPLIFEEHTLYIQASIGASVFPQDGVTVDELIKKADVAMYAIKNNGKNGYKIS